MTRTFRTNFAFRVDIWDDTGDSIAEHVAGRGRLRGGCLRCGLWSLEQEKRFSVMAVTSAGNGTR